VFHFDLGFADNFPPVVCSTTESAICEKSRFCFVGLRLAGFFVFLAMPYDAVLQTGNKD